MSECLILSGVTGSVAFTLLKQLSAEAREKRYPETLLVRTLHKAVKDADRCQCLGQYFNPNISLSLSVISPSQPPTPPLSVTTPTGVVRVTLAFLF